MSRNITKIVLIAFFSILSIVVLFFIYQYYSFKNAEELGYKETSKKKDYITHIINGAEIDKIDIIDSYQNSIDNRIIVSKYEDTYQLIVCNLNEFNRVKSSSIRLNSNSDINNDNSIYGLISTQEKPYMVFQSKTYLPSSNKLYINLDKNSLIIKEEHLDNIYFCQLKMTQISFGAQPNNNDFIISSFGSVDVSMMISTVNNDFTLCLLYPLKGGKININSLKKLIIEPQAGASL